MRDAPQCFRKRGWITNGPRDNAQCRSVVPMLLICHVALRHRFALWATLAHVTDNANDRHALKRIEGTKDCPAEWVLVGKRFSNHCFINHRDKRPIDRIALAEVTSVLKWNAQRRERARCDN